MKCVVCHRRKAKRFCPAKNESICTQCCGEKRVLEIDCPESCEFLKVGRIHEVREYTRYLRLIDPARREAHQTALDGPMQTVALLESVFARQRLVMRDLTDKAAAEAVDLLLDAYRTEENGILYQKTSQDLQAESLRRELRDVIEFRRNPEREADKGLVGSKDERLSLRSAIQSLEFVRDILASHMNHGNSPSSYIDLVARLIPREGPSGDARRSIIIP